MCVLLKSVKLIINKNIIVPLPVHTVERPSGRHQRQHAGVRVPGEQPAARQRRVLRGRGGRQGDRQRRAAGEGRGRGRRQTGRRPVRADRRRRRAHGGGTVLRGRPEDGHRQDAAHADRRAGAKSAVPAGGDGA